MINGLELTTHRVMVVIPLDQKNIPKEKEEVRVKVKWLAPKHFSQRETEL